MPTIIQLVSQARLRWLGHLARMPESRLPKELLFAFLPPTLGQVRTPGRREGKWLQYEFIGDLRNAGIGTSTWLQAAQHEHDHHWVQGLFSSCVASPLTAHNW